MAKNDVIVKIKDFYVGKDFCQLMIPHGKRIVLLSKEGVILQRGTGKSINKYLSDTRRIDMPYSNIPTHCTKFFGGKLDYSNVILDNQEIYLSFTDGAVSEYMSLKTFDGNTYYYARLLYPRNRGGLELSDLSVRKDLKDFHSREEVIKMLGKNDSDSVYYIRDDDVRYDSIPVPSEFELSESLDYDFHKEMKLLNELITKDTGNIGISLKNSELIKRLNQLDSDIDLFENAVDVFNGHVYFVVRVKDNDVTATGYRIYYLSEDTYFVDPIRLKINRVTYDDIKSRKFIPTTKSPKIRLKDNPDISKTELDRAKMLIKKKKEKSSK